MLRIDFQESFWRALRKAERKDPGLAAEIKAAIKTILHAENATEAKLKPKKGALKDIFVRNLSGGRRIFFRKEASGRGDVYVAFWAGEHDYYEKLSAQRPAGTKRPSTLIARRLEITGPRS